MTAKHSPFPVSAPPLLLAFALALVAAAPAAAFTTDLTRFDAVLRWSEEQRAFFQDGPGYLFDETTRGRLLDLPSDQRASELLELLADPIPETPENELLQAIAKRRLLVQKEMLSFQDTRARLLFVHGAPVSREKIDCPETYRPLEIWTYPGFTHGAVVFQPDRDDPWRLWLPVDGKRVIFNEEMAYYLDQVEELGKRILVRKPVDKVLCKLTDRVAEVTGINGIYGFRKERVKNEEILPYLDPPKDLAAWSRTVLAEPDPGVPLLEAGELQVFFPERKGQRMVTRFEIDLPDLTQLTPVVDGIDGELRELRFALEGLLEQPNETFERFRMRFQLPVPPDSAGGKVALIADRPYRPGQRFLVRLRLVEESSGRMLLVSRAVQISEVVTEVPQPPPTGDVLVAIAQDLGKERIAGIDSLTLIPPASDVVFGLWRAEALVTGSRIEKVKFLLDGVEVMSRRGGNYTAELRLSSFPKEQTVRAEGYDAQGELVASDEVVLNQPHGELRVRVIEPARGTRSRGEVKVKLEVVVPEEKKVARVTLLVNDAPAKVMTNPPWETTIRYDGEGELDFMTAVAELEDGSRAEDVRFLNAPEGMDTVEVDLVELYTTVTDKGGRMASGLKAADFVVKEDGRPQKIDKFELVQNLPLQIGVVIDTSGSMIQSLGEAQRAAIDFLQAMVGPRDRCFALSFSERPKLLMERTSDVGAVAEQLEGLTAIGATALHDAVVTSLYYFRGVRGRRALVVLSDGEDTASSLQFKDALEYARRSGVSIYAIGLRIGKADFGVRKKLDALAEETGGRTFYIDNAADLGGAYAEIENELRSQYLVAYNSDQGGKQGFREIAVEVQGGKLQARTIRGYYP